MPNRREDALHGVRPACGDPSGLPGHGVFGLVAAVRTSGHRRLEVAPELGELAAQAADRRPDAVGDGRAGPLGGAARAAGPAAEAERTGQVLDDGVELGLGPIGPGVVVVGLGLVDLGLEVADALLVLAAGRVVDDLAGPRLLGPGARQLQAVDFLAGGAEQPGQVGEALRRAQRQLPPRPGDVPGTALQAEPAGARRGGGGGGRGGAVTGTHRHHREAGALHGLADGEDPAVGGWQLDLRADAREQAADGQGVAGGGEVLPAWVVDLAEDRR